MIGGGGRRIGESDLKLTKGSAQCTADCINRIFMYCIEYIIINMHGCVNVSNLYRSASNKYSCTQGHYY